MKKTFIALALVFLFQVFVGFQALMPNACAQPMDARVVYFYDELRPYGEWMLNDRFGWCWAPYNVPVDWRPYTDGNWVETDYGLTWESDYPWGWACFHYGRWFFDDNYGWLWYPDTVWAPSWVAWRYGDDYIGWAPLPPEAVWDANAGLIFTDSDADDFIPYFAFHFSRRNQFFEHHVHRQMSDPARNVTLMGQTSRASNTLRRSGNGIVNQVPFENGVIKDAGRPIGHLKVVAAADPLSHGISDSQMRVFRPEMNQKAAVTVHAAQAKREVTGRVSSLTTPSAGSKQNIAPADVRKNFAPKAQVQTEWPAPAKQNIAPVTSAQNLTPRWQPQQVPPEVTARHQTDMKALEQLQNERRNALVQQHAQELKSVPEGPAKQQVIEQHKAETSASQQQASIENKVVQNWHQREIKTLSAPQAVPPVSPGVKFKMNVKEGE